jgi:inner membrane protein
MERKSTQREVIQEIGRNHVRHQVMLAPFIAVPVQSTAPCKDPKQQGFICTTQMLKVITPKTSDWQHRLTVSDDQYGHGIYRPITYQDQLSITGQFVPDLALLNPTANQQVLWDQAKLYLGLSDLRGLRQQPVLTVGQQKYVFDLPQ